jgi:serine protease Do
LKTIRRIERIRRINNAAFALVVIAVLIPRPAAAQREPVKGWVGVAYTTGIGQTDRTGAMIFKDYPVIESIEPNSPAERAGLEAGDTIIAMNAQDLKKSPLPMAAMIQPGRRVVFRFKRDEKFREVTITVAPRPTGTSEKLVVTMFEPAPAPGPQMERARTEMMRRERINAEIAARVPVPPMLLLPTMGPRSLAVAGAEMTALNAGLRSLVGLNSPGIFVVNVALGTPAKESGLLPGDVILRAESSLVEDPGDLIRVLRDASGSSIKLRIVRNKKPQLITLRW